MSKLLKKMQKKANKPNKTKQTKPQVQPLKKKSQQEDQNQETLKIDLVDISQKANAKHKQAKIKLNKDQKILNDDGQFVQSTKWKNEQPKLTRTTWVVTQEVQIIKKFDPKQEQKYFRPIGQQHLIPQAPKVSQYVQPGAAAKKNYQNFTPQSNKKVTLTKQQQKQIQLQKKLKQDNSSGIKFNQNIIFKRNGNRQQNLQTKKQGLIQRATTVKQPQPQMQMFKFFKKSEAQTESPKKNQSYNRLQNLQIKKQGLIQRATTVKQPQPQMFKFAKKSEAQNESIKKNQNSNIPKQHLKQLQMQKKQAQRRQKQKQKQKEKKRNKQQVLLKRGHTKNQQIKIHQQPFAFKNKNVSK